MPFTAAICPAGQLGAGVAQPIFDASQLNPATHRPAMHATAPLGSCCSAHLLWMHVSVQAGAFSPGASAWQVQQSECSVHSLSLVHSGWAAPPPVPPVATPPAPAAPPAGDPPAPADPPAGDPPVPAAPPLGAPPLPAAPPVPPAGTVPPLPPLGAVPPLALVPPVPPLLPPVPPFPPSVPPLPLEPESDSPPHEKNAAATSAIQTPRMSNTLSDSSPSHSDDFAIRFISFF
jgi:hypothetical protein